MIRSTQRLAGERQGALLDDLRRPVAGDVLHHDDHAAGAVDEVHRAAHAVDHLPGDQPVGQVAAGVDLHGAEDGDVEVLAADHPERHAPSRRSSRPAGSSRSPCPR